VGGVIDDTPVVDVGAWRLILLDSTVRGASHGELDGAQRARLERALAETQRPAIVAMHHGPARYCPSSGCQLRDADAFVAQLTAHPNARAVIAGHGHVDVAREAAHVRLFVTPSTCSQAVHAQAGVDHEDFWASHRFDASRVGYRMLTLGDDGALATEVHWIARA
jgi:Icc protein